MPKKKKPVISTQPSSLIKTSDISKNDFTFQVSFAKLDLENKKYSMKSLTDNRERIDYNSAFFKKMQEYGKHSNFKKYINDNKNYADNNHIHPIDWNDNRIRENRFTSLDNETWRQVANECWQLGINGRFRIHGYFVENVFYIIWLDPMHNLYHMK